MRASPDEQSGPLSHPTIPGKGHTRKQSENWSICLLDCGAVPQVRGIYLSGFMDSLGEDSFTS